MKNILVPTDFSLCSVNALNYAAELSKYTRSKIYLLHVYQPVIPSTDIPVIDFVSDEELERGYMEEMDQLIADQKAKHGWDSQVISLTQSGITPIEINNVIKNKKIDLVIMGMRGKTVSLDKFLGSNATEMIKKAQCPLLLIPEKEAFHFPHQIAVAFDSNHTADLHKISVTKEFVRLFNSKLLAFTIIKDKGYDAFERDTLYNAIDKMLKNYEHSIHFDVHADIPEGILSFIKEYQANILVIFHHSHNIFARIFSSIISKEISFDIKIPLLVVNEKTNIYPPVDL